MVKSHTLPWHLNQSAVMGGQAAQVRLERMHAFVEEVENAAREHERRIIIDWLAMTKPPENTPEWQAGFDEGISEAIRILEGRSHTTAATSPA